MQATEQHVTIVLPVHCVLRVLERMERYTTPRRARSVHAVRSGVAAQKRDFPLRFNL